MSAPSNQVAPWEDFVLRLIGVYKMGKSLLFFAAGLGVRNLLHRDVAQFLNQYLAYYHFDSDTDTIDPENHFLHRVVDWCLIHASSLTDHRIRWISYGAFFLAAIFALEGIGLYLRKHWAEYVVVASTGLLLPVEVYELYLKLAWWKFGVLVGNLLIVGYLIHRILLDARMKAARLEQNRRDTGEEVASGLNGNHSAPGNRTGASGPVSTKSR